MPQRFEGSGSGVVSQPQTFAGVPLSDHHVTLELRAILRVFLNDRNDDDRFAWAVDHARLRSPVSDPGVIL